MTDNARFATLMVASTTVTLVGFGALLSNANDRHSAVKQEVESIAYLTVNPELEDPFTAFNDLTTGLKSALEAPINIDGEATISLLNLNELSAAPHVDLDKDATVMLL